MSSLRKSHRKKHSRSSVLNIRSVLKTAVTAATGCFLQSNHQITAFSAREGTRRQYRSSCNENISIETYYCWSSSFSYERGSSRHSSSSTRAYAFSQSPSGHPDSIISSSSGPNESRRQSSSSRVGSDSRRTGRLGAWARLRKLPFMSRGGQGGVSSKHQHHHSHHNSDRHPIVIGHAGEHHSVTELSASSISEALSLEESVEMRGKIAEYKIAQFSREVAHELEIILDQWYIAHTKSRNAQIISTTRSPSQINHETLSDLFAWYFERLITSTTAQHITNDIDVLKNVLDAELTPDAYNFALIRTPDEASHIDPKSNLLKMRALHESSGIEIRGSQTISLSLDDDKDNTKESALQKLIEKSVYNRLKVWSTHMRNVEVKARLHNHFVFRALLRGQIRSDVRAKFDRLAFPNLKISGGGRIDVNGCALSLLSIAPGIGDIYNGKRYVQPFEFYVDCILNQDDIFQSSCIKNGLQNLLNRILRRFSFSAAAVESVEIMDSDQISCSGYAYTSGGMKVPFKVVTGLSISGNGHILTFPGLSISVDPFHSMFMPVIPTIDLDIGANAKIESLRIIGKRNLVKVRARATVSSRRAMKLLTYRSKQDSNARYRVDLGDFVTTLGRFNE